MFESVLGDHERKVMGGVSVLLKLMSRLNHQEDLTSLGNVINDLRTSVRTLKPAYDAEQKAEKE